MSVTSLERFYQFVGSKIHTEGDSDLSPEDVLRLWREREATLAAIREGLSEVASGETIPLEDYEREFRKRHGLGDEV